MYSALFNEESAEELLCNALRLQQCDIAVYLNSDLTPAKREVVYDQRQKWHQQRQQQLHHQQPQLSMPLLSNSDGDVSDAPSTSASSRQQDI